MPAAGTDLYPRSPAAGAAAAAWAGCIAPWQLNIFGFIPALGERSNIPSAGASPAPRGNAAAASPPFFLVRPYAWRCASAAGRMLGASPGGPTSRDVRSGAGYTFSGGAGAPFCFPCPCPRLVHFISGCENVALGARGAGRASCAVTAFRDGFIRKGFLLPPCQA